MLIAAILPGQREMLEPLPDGAQVPSDHEDRARAPRSQVARLGMLTGVFNLLWAVVVVLMVVRPGSTTGA
ncbi:hypothetical protein E4198_01140 [Streptomyces sp. RKND-216]|nr:hypothetical protein E4198_01140 [Streptomyces sp. RKND-216]